ncbi:hypothetical protein [Nannocystis pusilla]|uniref:hypothetical protein n=1 Tax=Nannocystis pusilla TaxID=889268 RepID=UPI003B78991D
MPRTLDAVLKHDELLALLGSGDARGLYDAARAAMVALEFRATDAMLGLTPVNDHVVARLAEAVRAALREAAGLGLHEAACELGRLLFADGDSDAAFAAVAEAAEAGHGPSAVLAARIAGRPWGRPATRRRCAGYPRRASPTRTAGSTSCSGCTRASASAGRRTTGGRGRPTRRRRRAATPTRCSSCT